MQRHGLSGTTVTITCLLGLSLGGQTSANQPPPDPSGHHEVPGEKAVLQPVVKRLTPDLKPRNNPFGPVQVNVDDNGNNYWNDAANEPSIVVDPTAPNRMAIGWRQFDNFYSSFRQAGWAYSTDGGRSWTFPGVIEPGVFRSDPVLDTNAEGVFFYNSLSSSPEGDFWTDIFISEDGGKTWGDRMFAFGGDKQWMAIDRTYGIGHGNIYANWTAAFSACDGQFSASYDLAETWIDCLYLTGFPFWGTTSVGPDGALYIVGESESIVVVRSDTIQDPSEPPAFNFWNFVPLGAHLRNGVGPNPGGLLGQLWIRTDHSGGPFDGNVYVLGSVGPFGTDPLDIQFTRSANKGIHWTDPVRVNDDSPKVNAWQWFSTMSVSPTGRIDVIWADTRHDEEENLSSELFYAYSTDAGDTWSENVPLTEAFHPHLGWPQQNKIGDYYDMVSDKIGAHVAFSATFNGEQDVYYLRIGDYDCNDNGIGDSEDLAAGTSFDCDANGIPDECEIAANPDLDADGSGVLDSCEARGDLNGDGIVDVVDLLVLLGQWGPCPPPDEPCPADLDGNGVVDVLDLLALLGNWG